MLPIGINCVLLILIRMLQCFHFVSQLGYSFIVFNIAEEFVCCTPLKSLEQDALRRFDIHR